MKYYVLPYCLKIWATTVILAPIPLILYFLIADISHPRSSGIFLSAIGLLFQVYLVFIAAGAALSFITFIIFWSTGVIVYRNITGTMHRKLVMSLIGAVLTALTFLLPFFLLSPDDVFNVFPLVIMSIYCFCTVFGSLIYHFD